MASAETLNWLELLLAETPDDSFQLIKENLYS
jgi:hypothetical protein